MMTQFGREIFGTLQSQEWPVTKGSFYLPITKNWLFQLLLVLVLGCHCSYRGVVELFRDLFDISIIVGTIHNRIQSAAELAAEINQAQTLSSIEVGLHDEIFQGAQPVLVDGDAASAHCYLLKSAEHRDKDSWGYHLIKSNSTRLRPRLYDCRQRCRKSNW